MATLREVDFDPFASSPAGKALPFDRNAALAETDKALNLPAGFSAAQIQVESGGNPKARSSAGAMGLAQVMPATLAVISKRLGRELDPDNEKDAVDIHREVMRENLAKFKDPAKALMAYNGGWDPDKWDNPETAAYVGKVKVKGAMKSGQNPIMATAEKMANAVIPSAQAAQAPKEATLHEVDFDPFAATSPAPAAPKRSTMDSVAQGTGNLLAGALRGAGSIGATLVAPYDMAKDALEGKGLSLASNRQRRADMDGALQTIGAEPESWLYRGGKLGAEVAGTLGVGGGLASGVRAAGSTRALAGLEPITNAVATGLQTGGFRVGELAGTGLGAATRVATGAATGGATAALVNPEDGGIGAAIGGALPGAVQAAGVSQAAIVRSMRAILGAASPEVRQLATRAQELGIKIPADRLLDSDAMNAMASSLRYIPLSGRTATEEAMNTQLNKALSRTFGQDSSNVTQALRRAQDQLGSKFETTLTANGVAVDRQLLDDLAAVYNKAETELGSEGLRPIDSKIKEIAAKGESGLIDGRAAYAIKRDLDRLGKANTPNAWHAVELKRVLMDALDRSLGPEKAAEFATVRRQYGNMLALEKLAKNGVDGELSVARIANLPNINNDALQEIADIAAQFVKTRESAHGAAQRVYGALGAPAIVGGAGAIAGIPGAIAAGGVIGVGRVANKVLNSQAMRKAILNPTAAAVEPATMGRLAQGIQRALPLTGATMATNQENVTPPQDVQLHEVDFDPFALPAPSADPTQQPEPPARIDLNGMVQPEPTTDPAQQPAQEPMGQDVQPGAWSGPAADPAPVFATQARADGTLAVTGDRQALREMLTAAGVPVRSMVPITGGMLIGRSQAAMVKEAIERMNAAATDPDAGEASLDDQEATPSDGADLGIAEGGPIVTDSRQAAPDSAVSVTENPVLDIQNADIVAETSPPEVQAPIDIAAHGAATSPQNDLPEPTPGQQQAGNYKLGHDRIAGMDISIENPQGSVRRGVDPDGKPWETQMQHHYGYFRRTSANDGDKLDVFVKPGTPRDYSGPVYVIDQVDPRTGKLDEHKTILGAKDETEAKEIYRRNYAADWRGMGSITRLPLPVFKAWAASGDKKHPLGDLQGEQTQEPPIHVAASADQAGQDGFAQAQEPALEAQPPQSAPVDRIQALRDAGENKVADMLQRKQVTNVAQTELASMQAATPHLGHHGSPVFNDHYQQQRFAGRGPAEASAFAGVMHAVQQVAPAIEMPAAAIKALTEKLKEIPIDEAPGFVERFAHALAKRGVLKPLDGSSNIAGMIESGRDAAMNGALDSFYQAAELPSGPVSV